MFILDGGSNTNIINKATADAIQETQQGVTRDNTHGTLTGIGDTTIRTIGHITMKDNRLVDKYVIIEEGDNIIATTTFTKQGLVVIQTEDHITVVNNNGKTQHEGKKNPQSGLYEIKMWAIVNATKSACTQDDRKAQINNNQSKSEQRAYVTRAIHNQADIKKAKQLHKNVGHIPFSTMAEIIEQGIWHGVDERITPTLLRYLAARRSCVICAISRWNHNTRRLRSNEEYDIGEAVSIDYMGKYNSTKGGQNTDSRGYTGLVLMVDLAVGFHMAFGVKSKKAIKECIDTYILYLATYGWTVKKIRCDVGGETAGKAIEAILQELHQVTIISRPDKTPEYTIERPWQTVKLDVAALIASKIALTKADWLAAALFSANVLRNIIPNTKSKQWDEWKTPAELITKIKPNVKALNNVGFGDVVVIKRTPDVGSPLGIATTKNIAARCMGLDIHKHGIYTQVMSENTPTEGRNQRRRQDWEVIHIPDPHHTEKEVKIITNPTDRGEFDIIATGPQATGLTDLIKKTEEPAAQALLSKMTTGSDSDTSESDTSDIETAYDIDNKGNQHIQERAYKARIQRTADNPSIKMVENNADLYKRWIGPIQEELKGMVESHNLHRIPTEEARAKAKLTPVVWALSTKANGTNKARMNVDGRYEIRAKIFEDTEDHYVPPMDESSIKTQIGIAAYYGMKLVKSDLKQAFNRINRMDQATNPRNIIIWLPEYICEHVGGAYYQYSVVGYGTADASRELRNHVTTFLTELRYTMDPYDPAMFVKSAPGQARIIIGLQTDDFLQSYTPNKNGKALVEELHAAMATKRWEATHEWDPTTILNITIIHNNDGAITLRQDTQINKIYKYFFHTVPPTPTYTVNSTMISATELTNSPATNATEYRRALGNLTHMRFTRNDIKYALARAGEAMQNPKEVHRQQLNQIAALIITTKAVGLTFQKGNGNICDHAPATNASSDASWATTHTGHSVLAYQVSLGSYRTNNESNHQFTAPIMARTIKEKDGISESVLEAELKAQLYAINGAEVLQGSLQYLTGEGLIRTTTPTQMYVDSDVVHTQETPHEIIYEMYKQDKTDPVPTTVTQDNASLYGITKRDESKRHKKIRHLSRKIQYVRDKETNGTTHIIRVPSAEQRSDPLTKNDPTPAKRWRQTEWIQGSHPAIDEIVHKLECKQHLKPNKERGTAETDNLAKR